MGRTRAALLFVSISVFFSALLFSGGRKPPAVEDSNFSIVRYDWVRDGHTKKIKATRLGDREYFRIGELARLSNAQLRWQSVTQQACLSRTSGLMCFNWDRSAIYDNGDLIKKSYNLHYKESELYVPIEFVTSKHFQKFTQSNIVRKKKERILLQDSPVTLNLPPVENFGEHYRLSVEFDKKTAYQVLEQSEKKIWIRFLRGRFLRSEILKGDRVIKEVRVNQKRRSADLVVKLGPKAGSSDLFFDKKTNKLLIEVQNKQGGYPSGVPIPVVKTPDGSKKSAKASRKRYKPSRDQSIRTVVIDAGHGGKDSGAIGVRGTFEKTINLKMAKLLAKELKKRKDLRVILTRDNDKFLALSDRTEIANEARADLFVSIHCNSSFSSKTRGFEVYILAEEATDQAAAAVARVENSVVRLESKSKKANSKLNTLLASMAVYNFINESSECAAHICRGVKKKTPVKSTAVREANFHVLRGAQMPGVLVELEYLSNPVTEQKLRSSRYRAQLARGIAAGIVEYDRRTREKIHPVTAKSKDKQQDF